MNEKCKCCANAQSDGDDGLCSVCREVLQSPEIAAELRAIFEEPAEVES